MKKQNILSLLGNLIPLVLRQAPFFWLVSVLISITGGAILGLMAPFNQRLFDTLSDIAVGEAAVNQGILAMVFVVGLMISTHLIDLIGGLLDMYKYDTVWVHLNVAANKALSYLPAQEFESKQVLDDLEKFDSGATLHAMGLFESIRDLLFNSMTFIIVTAIFLWSIQPILLLALFFTFVPVFFSQMYEASAFTKNLDLVVPLKRQAGHLTWCSENLYDTRLLGAFHYFYKLLKSTLKEQFDMEWKTCVRTNIIQLSLNLVQVAGWSGIVILLVRGLRAGDISVGSFVAVFIAIGTMFSQLESIAGTIHANLTQNWGYYIAFLRITNLKADDLDKTPPDFEKFDIVARDLNFSYPDIEKLAVSDVNLVINKNETIGIVGVNGSGKTTLAKLLCGLYKPTSGTVIFGGRDITTTANEPLFSQTSAVFQNYVTYSVLDLKENVTVSDHTSPVDAAQYIVDAEIDYENTATFPQGLSTILSREFDGVQLSQGQLQRVALARGKYRRHSIIILDEPTASIDPIEETHIYEAFTEYAKDKTAILISHRLGSVRNVDRIIVMQDGKIVEVGNHNELLEKKGLYADMWSAQSSGYINP